MYTENLLRLVLIIVGIGLLGIIIELFRSGFQVSRLTQIVFPRAAQKKRVWQLLSSLGGVESSVMDSNPRVRNILQPAFHGALRPLTYGRSHSLIEQQIMSTPDDQWIAAYVLSDIADRPNDGKPEMFKAEATVFVFARKLTGESPEISFVNKAYWRRSFLYMPAWKISQGELTYCEGVFMDKFAVYARPEEQINALAFAAPDLLLSISDNVNVSDIYFQGGYVYFLMPVWKINEQNIAELFEVSMRLVAEANSNLPRVSSTIKHNS